MSFILVKLILLHYTYIFIYTLTVTYNLYVKNNDELAIIKFSYLLTTKLVGLFLSLLQYNNYVVARVNIKKLSTYIEIT